MIIDKTQNAALYSFGEAWTKAFAFLASLTPESEERKYSIDGDDIFAIVMSYDTAAPELGLYESHREYVDIQSVLIGTERFECELTQRLEINDPYDAAKEATFYKRSNAGYTSVDVTPETFVMLYPHDAHLAGLIVGESSARVKKVVVKVRKSLLGL
ncbi:MAG: YhcH/YjgK/YiaL family protein [Sulfurimonas sp.]|nr:YhcH/YjgK/YiaL family protein [Sulfurimonas sp.]